MVECTIQLSDEQATALADRAAELGVEPDVQLQSEVANLLDERRQRIRRHIKDIVREHRGLYERLS